MINDHNRTFKKIISGSPNPILQLLLSTGHFPFGKCTGIDTGTRQYGESSKI